MIPVSTVPAVRSYLRSAIVAQIADPTVQVFDGVESTNVADDVVLVAGVQRQSSRSAMVGNGQQHALEETYQLEVRVSCFRGGGEDYAPTVDARAWALIAQVESVVRSDMSLGGLVLTARPGISQSSGPQWEDEHKGVICEVFMNIDCYAQL